MKDKILPVVIGMLIGAIITAAGFMIYLNNHKGNRPDFEKFQQMTQENGERPELPNGERPSDFKGGKFKNNQNSSSSKNSANPENPENAQNSSNAENNDQTQSNTL